MHNNQWKVPGDDVILNLQFLTEKISTSWSFLGKCNLRECMVLPKSHNCQAMVMLSPLILPAKATPIFDFRSCNWGRGIRYWEITGIASLHFRRYSGLKRRLPFVICHRTLFFFRLSVSFLFFSSPFIVKKHHSQLAS